MSLSEQEIVSTRIVDVAREVVFRAWIEPEPLARWWGPNGFTNTFQEFDPRPGGAWRFIMRSPDGTEFPMNHRFVEIDPPQKIVIDHLQAEHTFRITATFDDIQGKTRITFHMLFKSAAECTKVRAIILEKNEENFDRLQAELKTMVQ